MIGVNIYQETMRRVGAPSSYLFDEDYVELFAAELGSALRLFVALVDGEVAAAGLFEICDGIVQVHLGALSQEDTMLAPTRLLDDTARRSAVEAGALVFHLEGGRGRGRGLALPLQGGLLGSTSPVRHVAVDRRPRGPSRPGRRERLDGPRRRSARRKPIRRARMDLRIIARTVRQVLRREAVAVAQDLADLPLRFQTGLQYAEAQGEAGELLPIGAER